MSNNTNYVNQITTNSLTLFKVKAWVDAGDGEISGSSWWPCSSPTFPAVGERASAKRDPPCTRSGPCASRRRCVRMVHVRMVRPMARRLPPPAAGVSPIFLSPREIDLRVPRELPPPALLLLTCGAPRRHPGEDGSPRFPPPPPRTTETPPPAARAPQPRAARIARVLSAAAASTLRAAAYCGDWSLPREPT